MCSRAIFAQDIALKVNPASLFFNGVEFSFEARSSESSIISSEFTGAYIDYKINENKLSAFAAEVKLKFLLANKVENIEGTYIAPLVSLISGKINYRDINVYGIGAVAGYQFIFQNKNKNGFLIDLFGGFIYNSASVYQLDASTITGFKPRLGISLGYAF